MLNEGQNFGSAPCFMGRATMAPARGRLAGEVGVYLAQGVVSVLALRFFGVAPSALSLASQVSPSAGLF